MSGGASTQGSTGSVAWVPKSVVERAGTPVGPPCARCKRTRSCPNPIRCDKYASEFLPFTSTLCVPCTNLGQVRFRGRPVPEVTAEVNSTPHHQKMWMKGVSDFELNWLECHNAGKRTPKNRDYGVICSTILASQGSSVSASKLLGWGWPEDAYLREFGENGHDNNPEWRKLLKPVEVEKGEFLPLITLDESWGRNKVGCYKLKKKFEKGLREEDELANSAQHHDVSSLNYIFREQSKKLKVECKQNESTKTIDLQAAKPLLVPAVPAEEKTGDLSDDSSDLEVDYLSGGLLNAPKENGGKKKKRPATLEGDQGQRQPKRRCAGGGGSTGKSAQAKAERQLSEIQATEAVLADAKRTQHTCTVRDAFTKVSTATLKGCIDKVMKRMGKPLLAVYTALYPGAVIEDPLLGTVDAEALQAMGEKLTDDCRVLITSVSRYHELWCNCVGGPKKSRGSSQDIWAAMYCMELEQLPLPDQARYLLSESKCLDAYESCTFDRVAVELLLNPGDADKHGILAIVGDNEEDKEVLQTIVFESVHLAVMDSTSEQNVKQFFYMVDHLKSYASVFQGFLSNLSLHNPAYTGEGDVHAAYMAFKVGAVLSPKASLNKTFRAILGTPLGLHLNKCMLSTVARLEAEKSATSRLLALPGKFEALAIKGAQHEWCNVRVYLMRCKYPVQELFSILGNSSEEFQKRHKDVIEKSKLLYNQVISVCLHALAVNFWDCINQLIDCIMDGTQLQDGHSKHLELALASGKDVPSFSEVADAEHLVERDSVASFRSELYRAVSLLRESESPVSKAVVDFLELAPPSLPDTAVEDVDERTAHEVKWRKWYSGLSTEVAAAHQQKCELLRQKLRRDIIVHFENTLKASGLQQWAYGIAAGFGLPQITIEFVQEFKALSSDDLKATKDALMLAVQLHHLFASDTTVAVSQGTQTERLKLKSLPDVPVVAQLGVCAADAVHALNAKFDFFTASTESVINRCVSALIAWDDLLATPEFSGPEGAELSDMMLYAGAKFGRITLNENVSKLQSALLAQIDVFGAKVEKSFEKDVPSTVTSTALAILVEAGAKGELSKEVSDKALKETQSAHNKKVFKTVSKMKWITKALPIIGDKLFNVSDEEQFDQNALSTAWTEKTVHFRRIVANNTAINGLFVDTKMPRKDVIKSIMADQIQPLGSDVEVDPFLQERIDKVLK